MSKFYGVYAVVVTPFKKDSSFDFDNAKKNLDYLIKSGVHGVCIMGATSEYLSVTNNEYIEYINEIIPYINNRVPVGIGAARERPEEVIELIKAGKQSGAEIAMVLPPYYYHASQDEIYDYFEYITNNVDLPIMVYNNPHSAGINIEHTTMKRIQNLKNINAVKESTGDIHNTTELIIESRKDLSIFCGCDNLAFEAFCVGANGWISMLANIAPKNCVELFKLVKEDKNYEKAFELYKKMLPCLNLLENYGKPTQILKYLLTHKGYNGGFVRKPRVELTEDEKAYILKTSKIDELE